MCGLISHRLQHRLEQRACSLHRPPTAMQIAIKVSHGGSVVIGGGAGGCKAKLVIIGNGVSISTTRMSIRIAILSSVAFALRRCVSRRLGSGIAFATNDSALTNPSSPIEGPLIVLLTSRWMELQIQMFRLTP